MPFFLRSDFRLSKKPLRKRERERVPLLMLSLMVEAQCLTSNIKGLWNWTWQKYWISCSYEKIKKQMIKICTISLPNIFLGIWYGDLGSPPHPQCRWKALPYPTYVWYFQFQGSMSFLFYAILTPMDICWSHSIATVSHSLLVLSRFWNNFKFNKYTKCSSGLDRVNSKLIMKYKLRLFYL